MSDQIILITGANRGICRGLVSEFLLRRDHTVIAATRDPKHRTSQYLESLPRASGSRVILVKSDATSETDAAEAVRELESKHEITRIDVLIANAGISKNYARAIDTPVPLVLEHFTVNAVGPLYLIQAFIPMLKASPHPKFVALSTGLATIGGMGDLPLPFPI